MRTSLEEIKKIEDFLLGQQNQEDRLVMEAYLILNEDLKRKLHWQKKAYEVIKEWGRKQLKAELEAVHFELFNTAEHASFSKRIYKLFNL